MTSVVKHPATSNMSTSLFCSASFSKAPCNPSLQSSIVWNIDFIFADVKTDVNLS